MPRPLVDGPETPPEHVRLALAWLAYARARVAGLTIPPDTQTLELLDGVRRALWRAVDMLEHRTDVFRTGMCCFSCGSPQTWAAADDRGAMLTCLDCGAVIRARPLP